MTAVSLMGKPFYFCYSVLKYRVFSNDRDQLKKGMTLTMSDLQAACLWENLLEQTMSMRMYAIEKR